ncbi:queuosine biosynthesis protein [Labrys miyagiensis]|uniref:Queuosine biosynthesis protein n=1 Tax=Labrys miyagiensis TaxID=346912 RepID=A0ABQ6CNF4_9HYPH|nr:S-adenosylmethionine:tRNA ribosyltransferase-isomerase [Labrys miyagiensis]GLS21856.1 queuosine biosynthesis protein [Labrys miyagiensis]
MIVADSPDPGGARLLAADAGGRIRHLPRQALGLLFRPDDLVIANDAATLPASLQGRHEASGAPVEIRLAAWLSPDDPLRFVAVAFGGGDHRIRTEDRPLPPPLVTGDRLTLGPLTAVVEGLLDHPRLLALRFEGDCEGLFAGLARHGLPIQYAHVPETLALWDVWTVIAAEPFAFEAPSAGFALDWRTIDTWRTLGVRFATLTHAAGISSTGDPLLDRRFPLDERYRIPAATAAAVARTQDTGGRIIAVGTSVVRALEAAAVGIGHISAGPGVARGRIGPDTPLRIVDAIVTGVHQPGESHFELLRAFADDVLLHRLSLMAEAWNYRTHEFGDSMLIER